MDDLWAPITGWLQGRRSDADSPNASELEDLRGILDAIPVATITQTQDGRVQSWNRAAERIFGWNRAEIADQPMPFIPPEEHANEAALRQRILAGNEVFRTPVHFLDRDGETLHLLLSAMPRRNAEGKIVGVVSIFEEPIGGMVPHIAPPRVKQAATRSPQDESAASTLPPRTSTSPDAAPPAARAGGLDEATRRLARVSHDLRQPLHALSLLTGALERRVTEAKARELVADAGTMVRSLQASFDNLVDLSRLDEGLVQAQPVALPVNDILAPLVAEFAREAASRNIAFRHVGSSAIVRSDPLLLQRVLRHLLSNALRFGARSDGMGGKVLLGARRVGNRVRLIVADDGIGILQDQQTEIFELFVQSEAGRAAGGLGLGLALAQRLAALLGNGIGLRSAPDRGSYFWIEVPLESPGR